MLLETEYLLSMKKSTVVIVFFSLLSLLIPVPAGAQTLPVVYLTFDDGPHVTYTPQYLDLLAQYDARGTFFVNGHDVNSQTVPMLQRMIDEGHAIANHTQGHPKLTTLSYNNVRSQFRLANDAVRNAVGYEMTCYRPPFGATNQSVHNAALAEGLPNSGWTANHPSGHLGGWDIDTNDWRFTQTGIRNELNKIRGGEVVLMHDGTGRNPRGLDALKGWMADNAHRFQFEALPDCGAQTGPRYIGERPNGVDDARWYEFQIERLYQAYFLRPADAEGFEYLKGIRNSGVSFNRISDYFEASDEFQNRYGMLTDGEYVELLYHNVLMRPSDAEGKAYWLDVLNGGHSRGDVMLYFSESDEFVAATESELTFSTTYEIEAQRRVDLAENP